MIKYLEKIISRFQQRSTATAAISYFEKPVLSDMSVKDAVKEGYALNGWVYRCVYLIQKAVASVPFKIYNENTGEFVEHNLNKILANPCPEATTRQDWYELMTSWMELAGNAYAMKVQGGGGTQEIWPVSPDRISPVESTKTTEWITGYALKTKEDPAPQNSNTKKEDVLHLKYINPAKPCIGIAPLQAASAALQIDNSQKSWTYSNSELKGALEGVFMFDKVFSTVDEAKAVQRDLNKTLTGKKGARYHVLGRNAKFQPITQNQESRDSVSIQEFNRDEIHVIFGVPPQLTGAIQAKYDNYQDSEIIFWLNKVMFTLNDMADGFTMAFRDELKHDFLTVKPDVSNVPAIRRALLDKTKTARLFSAMGVPFENINEYFQFGFEEFEGWDKPYSGESDSALEEETRSSNTTQKKTP